MVQQTTQGINVSVRATFEGTFYKHHRINYAYAYKVTIENTGKDAVQLTSRYWKIFDSLNNIEVVEGDGVIGVKPVLEPGDTHSYSSGCLLLSPIGAMKGYYSMVNFTTTKKFKVTIPSFRLSAPSAMN